MSDETLFAQTYDTSRDLFVAEAGQYDNARIQEFRTDPEASLLTHTLLLPAITKPQRLLVITSGIHGVEGYIGSVIQRLFLKSLDSWIDRNTTGILLIHAVNPYGFRHDRRVNAKNIDLNRNGFTVSGNFDKHHNQAYEQLQSFLEPRKCYASSRLFRAQARKQIEHHSQATVFQAAAGGQHHSPQGIFYGGDSQEPEVLRLREIITEHAKDYPTVFLIHLHSGFGQWGHLHLLYPTSPLVQHELLETLFAGLSINDYLRKHTAYEVVGSLCDFLGEPLRAEGKTYLPVSFEYGTLNTQTMDGFMETLRRMIVENQIHHWGAKTPEIATHEQQLFREMFYPDDPAWQRSVMDQTQTVFSTVFSRFHQI
ncbi:MAG: DUF2817 domain-containing protein [SAR324 cluster bacterium]|nr:DUF2817 domain-containing protein [SAR324 cluster bacterium]